jgi:hypothetical protein
MMRSLVLASTILISTAYVRMHEHLVCVRDLLAKATGDHARPTGGKALRRWQR